MAIRNPEDPDFVPYYEREGLNAVGVADEWLDNARRNRENRLRKLDPKLREQVAARVDAALAGEYENLQRFEARETRRGLILKMEDDIQTQAANVANSVRQQFGAFAAGRAARLEDARKTHDEAVRGLADDDPRRAEADKWLAMNDRDEQASTAAECDRLITETLAKIDMAEPSMDNAALVARMDPTELAARKRKAARAAYEGVVRTLVQDGNLDAADRFIDALDGTPEKPSPLAQAYGFMPTDAGALREDVKRARARMSAAAEAAEREARAAVVRDFTEKELSLRDVPQELWADEYDRMGKDAALKAADPVRAMRYRDAAAEMRAAAARAKGQATAARIKANEEALSGRLIDLALAKEFGDVSDEQYAEEQSAIWRDFAVAARGDEVGDRFKESFRADFGQNFTARQREAMRYVCDLFGYRGELDSSGGVPTTERRRAEKDGLDFYTPFKEEHWFSSDSPAKIPARDLFRFLDAQLRLIEAGNKGTDPVQAVKEAALKYKEGWMKGKIDGMINGAAESLIETQRRDVEKGELEAARTEVGNGR